MIGTENPKNHRGRYSPRSQDPAILDIADCNFSRPNILSIIDIIQEEPLSSKLIFVIGLLIRPLGDY